MDNTLEKCIYVAGHRGLAGSAIVRALRKRGFQNIVTRSRAELDLTDQAQVRAFFAAHRIDEIYLAAARVGGIHASNTYPAEFSYVNAMVQANVIHEAWRSGVKKLLFMGTSCIYPRLCEQPMREEYLLSGPLEPTMEAYGIAKIAGIKMCESYNRQYGTDYRCIMPCNLYGPGDNYHPENSHVLPALLRKFHEAKVNGLEKVVLWGTGTARREFLHSDDMAEACVHLMSLDRATLDTHAAPSLLHINAGSGEDISIGELAEMVRSVVGYQGRIEFDCTRPDGAPRKLMDNSRLLSLGWRPRIRLADGIKETYSCFVAALKRSELVER